MRETADMPAQPSIIRPQPSTVLQFGTFQSVVAEAREDFILEREIGFGEITVLQVGFVRYF
jgi:hypothetical protein